MGKNALGTLIRLTRQHLDNQRATLLDLAEQIRRLEAQILFLEKRIEAEEKISTEHPEYKVAFDFFRRHTHDRCFELSKIKATINQRFVELQDKVLELFKQKKSYEIAKEISEEKARKKSLVLEQKVLDEIPNRTFFLQKMD